MIVGQNGPTGGINVSEMNHSSLYDNSEYPSRKREPETAPKRRPKKRRRSFVRIIGGAMLYAVVVIVVSMILACLAWIAANDVLALNKEDVEVTITIGSEDTFDEIVDTLEEKGLIEYKFLFKLFAKMILHIFCTL